MRRIVVDCGAFYVSEHNESDFKQCLCREREGEIQEMGLYCAIVTAPWGTETIFVLAESEEGAEQQARCAVGGSFDWPESVRALVAVHLRRVPLIIRGWGRVRF